MLSAQKRMKARLQRLLPLLLALGLATAGVVVSATPAHAVGTYNNANIATDGLADLGQNPAPGGGQCKAFANAMVNLASGGTQSPSGYQSGWAALGTQVSSADAAEGDIIQITPAGSTDSTVESIYEAHLNPDGSSPPAYHLHTAIIVSNNGSNSFTVVDANFTAPYTVGEHTFDPYTWAAGSIIDIWQLGTVSGGSAGATAPDRIYTLDTSGNLSVKDGALDAGWTLLDQGVVAFAASDDMVAALDTSGELWVKWGSPYAVWQPTATGISPGDFAVTNDMVVVLNSVGDLSVQTSPGAMWTLVMNPVQSFAVSPGDHIAALMTSGDLNVLWGPVGSGWTDVTHGVTQFTITDDMLAVTWGNYLAVMTGSVDAGWTVALNPVQSFAVSAGDHIAGELTSSDLEVQWGPVGSGWTDVISNIDAYAISDDRVGVLQAGALSIKDGSVGATWTPVATDIVAFALTG